MRVTTAMVIAVLALPAAARAAPPDAEGQGCRELVVVTAVPAQAVEEQVPAPFQPTVVGGRALIGAAILSCERLDVAGSASPRTEISDTGVAIADPTGSGGTHFYSLWQLTSSPALRELTEGAGVRGSLVEGLEASTTESGPLTHSHGRAPWAESPFELTLDTTGSVPQGASATSWWHRAGDQLVRMDYAIGDVTAEAGTGLITASPGTHLARILGGHRAAGAGLVIEDMEFSLTISRTPAS